MSVTTKKRPRPEWRPLVLCLALAAITFAVFGPTLTHEFVDFDDNAYVYDNTVVNRGLTGPGFLWAFDGAHYSNWHPLTWLSHMLDCQLYGLRPAGHHLSNVLLHVAAVLALFLVLRAMTGTLWRSALVAAIFAVHPLRVESVAWVAERKDALAGLFFVLTVGAYARYARGPRSPTRYGLVLLLFALGLMSKPTVVTLPLVLLLLDYWPLQRKEPVRRLALEKLPLLALSAASSLATLLAQTDALQSTEVFSWPARFANALITCTVYLRQMVWPTGLAVIYAYPRDGYPGWEIALAVFLLATVSFFVWQQRRQRRWLAVGWLWYLLMLLPMLGIIQVGNQSHADRYTYLPQIGIYLALVWLAAELPWPRSVKTSLAVAVIITLIACAGRQVTFWKNSETLWTHALDCTTGNSMAEYGMGNVFLHKEDWAQAIAHYQKAVEINPSYVEAHGNLGLALAKMGRTNEAMAQFQTALQLHPTFAGAYLGLGNIFLVRDQLDEARACFEKAGQYQPDLAFAHGNLGVTLFRQGKTDEAMTQFRTAAQLAPNEAEARYNLGSALRQTGKLDEAIAELQMAVQLKPDYPGAHYYLGKALSQKGRTGDAIAQFRAGLQVMPSDTGSQNALAWLLATASPSSLRNSAQAVALARQANESAGGKNPLFLRTLAAAYAESGQYEEAKSSARSAIAIVEAVAGQQEFAAQLRRELHRYESGHPLHN